MEGNLNLIRLNVKPHLVLRNRYHFGMKLNPGSAKKILATNLQSVMGHQNLSQMGLHRRSGVAQATIGRILREESAADIDTLQALASGLGTESWQLLVPNLDPVNRPNLRILTAREREFYHHLEQAAKSLPESAR